MAKLFSPKECLQYWDKNRPIRSGKLFWLSVRKCIERAVEQDEMLEKSHIVLDEFVGKFVGSKVFIDNGNHNEEIRNKTIDEFVRRLNLKFVELPLNDLIVLDILKDIKRVAEQMKEDNENETL